MSLKASSRICTSQTCFETPSIRVSGVTSRRLIMTPCSKAQHQAAVSFEDQTDPFAVVISRRVASRPMQAARWS